MLAKLEITYLIDYPPVIQHSGKLALGSWCSKIPVTKLQDQSSQDHFFKTKTASLKTIKLLTQDLKEQFSITPVLNKNYNNNIINFTAVKYTS